MSNQSINIHDVTQIKVTVDELNDIGDAGFQTFGVRFISPGGVCEVTGFMNDPLMAERLMKAFNGFDSNRVEEEAAP